MSSRAAVRLAYSAVGPVSSKRSPLVVLHGLFGSKLNWRTLSRRLSEELDRRVFVLDARNHGESPHCVDMTYDLMSQDTIEFCRAEHINKAILIGHSMGGKTAMVAALTQPALVEGLVVLDVTPSRAPGLRGSEDIITALTRLDTSRVKNRQQADEALKMDISDSTLRQFLLTNLIPDSDRGGELQWRVNLPAIQTSLHTLKGFQPPASSSAQYSSPTLFIGGAESDYIRPEDVPTIRRFFPNAQVTHVPGAGHWLHYQQPEAFRKLVKEFVQLL